MERQFYTAEEAMKLLNMAKTTFYKEVEAGTIPSILERGRTRGRKFPKEAIDAHVRLLYRGSHVNRTFDKATNADLWTAIEYDRELYGDEDIISYRRALEWKEKNNEIFMMLKEGDELAGTVTFVPLEESTIHALINDKIREKRIPDWAIRKWSDSELSVYAATISIFPTGNVVTDKERGRSLLFHTIQWGLSLAQQHDIKNWYAVAATDEGEKLLRKLGFHALENETPEGKKLVKELGITLSPNQRKGYYLKDLKKAMPIVQEIFKKMENDDEWDISLPAPEVTEKP